MSTAPAVQADRARSTSDAAVWHPHAWLSSKPPRDLDHTRSRRSYDEKRSLAPLTHN